MKQNNPVVVVCFARLPSFDVVLIDFLLFMSVSTNHVGVPAASAL